jgi:integrase
VLSAHLAAGNLTAAVTEALLFPNRDGTPLDYSNWRRRIWLPATNAAGLSGLGFHDLRRAVSTDVNSVRNNGPELVRPI